MGPVDLSAIRRKHSRFIRLNKEAVSRASHEAGQAAVQYVREQPHFKPRTGNLQKQTDYKLIRTSTMRVVKVRNKAKYARAIESGSRPHTIRARRARALRFTMNGQIVFRKSVFHPGTRATHFLFRATTHGYDRLGYLLRSEMSRVARQF